MRVFFVAPWLVGCGYLSFREVERTDSKADAGSDGDGSDADVDSDTSPGSDSGSETGSGTESDECAEAAFTFETVDAEGDGASYSAVFVDGDSTHVFYQFKSLGLEVYEVRHATDASGAWVRETLDEATGVGFGLSAAMEKFGDFHLTYENRIVEPYDLHYATNTSGRWRLERVVGEPSVGDTQIAMAIDSDDEPHIVHSRRNLVSGTESLEHTASSAGDWSSETVSSWRAGGGVALAIDDSDIVHVTASSGERLGVDYWTNAIEDWPEEPVDEGFLSSTSYPKVLLGSDDAVHVVYVRPGQSIEHAERTEDGWTTETIDEGDYLEVAAVIGSRNWISVAYTDDDAHAVRYATNASREWIVETVEESGTIEFRWVSIAIDDADRPTISYERIDADRGSLLVARHCAP